MKMKERIWQSRRSWINHSRNPTLMRIVRENHTEHRTGRGPYHHSIEAAFKSFGLNPEDTLDRELLMGVLASIVFPELQSRNALAPGWRVPPGAPRGKRAETSRRDDILLQRTKEFPRLNHTEKAIRLRTKYRKDYGHL